MSKCSRLIVDIYLHKNHQPTILHPNNPPSFNPTTPTILVFHNPNPQAPPRIPPPIMSQPPASVPSPAPATNLPTPPRCVADFCLIPVRTPPFPQTRLPLITRKREKYKPTLGSLLTVLSRSEHQRRQYRLKSRMFSA